MIYRLLREVRRPGRYYSNDINIPLKRDAGLRFLLCFPDLYEIGMSNLGLRVLYHVLNGHPDIMADVAFAPWSDMEAFMRSSGEPLVGIGTSRPARWFHVLGFSLQHELQYTNVLNMLDLAGIPLKREERGDGDPVILAGGPCAFNPDPMSDFMDGFVIGDGESACREIGEHMLSGLYSSGGREGALRKLAEVRGVYVPALHGTGRERPEVERRVEAELKEEDFPIPPIVPLLPITHDRLTLEVMRGCTRGCRFCSAGMLNRPVRQRSADSVVRLAQAGIDASGWEEVSLVSLSTSDYYDLEGLVRRLSRILEARRVSISLPSMRPGTFSDEIAGLVGRAKKSGLTFAPEAGSPALRTSINKDVDEDQLYRTVETAFRHGWDAMKLYFMVGLPREDDSDIEGIVNMVRSVEAICRVFGKRKKITVSLSPFVPRPHTPFQWEAQMRPDEVLRRIRHLRKRLPGGRVKLKWRDPYMAALEGALSRGGKDTGEIIHAAWRAGARFDSWTDRFDFDLWTRCFEDVGPGMDRVFEPVSRDEPLPWDFIGNSVTRDFLVEEAEKAEAGTITPDCRTGPCTECGACRGKAPEMAPDAGETPIDEARRVSAEPANMDVRIRYRVKYAKTDDMIFTSHLDVMRCIQRALRRADVPVSYSSGFSPHPRVSFGPPLPLGMVGESEYFDVLFCKDPGGGWLDRVNQCLPAGLRLLKSRLVALQGISLMKLVNAADYTIEVTGGGDRDIGNMLARVEGELAQDERVMSVSCAGAGGKTRLDLSVRLDKGSVRPEKVVEKAIEGSGAYLRAIRRSLYREKEGILESPFGTPLKEEQKS